jgi:dihydroorotase-like cyclic amidohydrolase
MSMLVFMLDLFQETFPFRRIVAIWCCWCKMFLTHSGIDEFPNVTEKDLDEAMPIIAKYKLPLLAHCELYDEEVASDFENHPTSYQHYLASRPKKWENDAIDLMIRMCRKHQLSRSYCSCCLCRSFSPN